MIRVTNVNKVKMELSHGIHITMPCEGQLWSYIELIDRVIVVVNIYDIRHCNQYRNIFCYSKQDGHLIWQIEQPYGRDHQPLEAVYKYIALNIKGDNGHWLSIEENGSLEVDHKLEDGSEISGQVYLKPFRYGIDKLATMTLAEYPSEYWVDYETGKVEWFAIHQKV